MEDYIHPGDQPRVEEAIRQAVRTKGIFELEHRVRLPDGGLGWTLSRAVPILGADGGIVEWFGAATDVTARREAEERLRESEARWRGVFERMHQGFVIGEIIHGRDGRATDYRLLEVNPAWERQTGIPAAVAIGHPFREVVPGIEHFWVETHARVAETGEPAHVERHVAPLGLWLEVLSFRTGPGRFAALTLDATERRRAAARREALVELADRLRDLRDSAVIAHAAADIIGRTLGAARAGYGVVDAAQATFRVARDWTDGGVASTAGEWRVADFWADLAEEHGRGGVVAVADVARDPRTAARAGAYAAAEVRAFLDVPVVEAGRVAAILYVHARAPRAWTAEEVAFVRGVADRAWAAAERARAEERRTLLLKELNHRVKNSLAVVQSLAAQTARGAPDLPSFAAAFQARLIALARAHDLLTQREWRGAPLAEVARAALHPAAGGDEGRVDLGACASDALLPPEQALALAMALHELATNALKHGALSVPEGRVTVACRADPDDGARIIEWGERGGPPIQGPPKRRGFGLRLLERGLAMQAGMAADLRFEPEGLRCTLRLPPSRPVPRDATG